MTITLYTNNSDKDHVDKSLTEIVTISGTLRDECKITNPVILIEYQGYIANVNYCFISEFDRYYYCKIEIVNNKLIRLICTVDVLMSFRTQIRSNNAIIERQQDKWNLYINDPDFVIQQNPRYQYLEFPYGFGDYSYILTIAGGN